MGKHATEGTQFPKEGALDVGFETWLDHFLADERGLCEDGAYKCYNPWNMQARALTRAGLTHAVYPV